MHRAVLISALVLAATPALAQQPFSPLSGPNTAIPSPVCDIINFGFCPQPPGPAADLPDVVPPPRTRAEAPPPAPRRAARHRHRVRAAAG